MVDTGSTSLFVETVGDGPPCLIAHGGPGLHHGLYRSLDPLRAERGLVYWDHRGHGRSAPLPEDPVEMARFADDTVGLADALGIDRFALVGHSFGGWVALETALRHPERVTALVVVATTPGQLGATETPSEEQGLPVPDVVARLLGSEPRTDPEVVGIYTALAPYFMRDAEPAVMIDSLDPSLVSADGFRQVFHALSVWSAVDRLHQIRCPTLVLAGRHDLFCSPPQSARIATRVPQAELVTFEHSGHYMWFEEPDNFFSVLTGWLARHP